MSNFLNPQPTTAHRADSTVHLEPLLTAAEVAAYLKIGQKKVYGLPIAQIRLSDHRVRWCVADVVAYTRRSRRGAS